MILPFLLIPLFFAWLDLFRVPGQSKKRRALAAIGLLLLSSIPILSTIAIHKLHQTHGRLSHVTHLEQGMLIAALLSIPFLWAGYRMTKWLGIASALLLPLIAILVDTLI